MQSTNKYNILKKYWGFDTFRNLQEPIIDAVLEGQQVMAILPTGGGKSLCYQLPAIMLEGTALVISPLIALMNDQVAHLHKKNISAVAIHSAYNKAEITDILENAIHGKYKLIYLSPERLHSELFLSYASAIPWSFLAVDESHCISQWGHDFRPLYREITTLFETVPFRNIIALTASATPKVKTDIMEQLQLSNPVLFQESIIRDNLFYEVQEVAHKSQPILELTTDQTEIIYCPTRKKTVEVAAFLTQNQKEALPFHAGMPYIEKAHNQELWMQSEKMTICATSAFGMGIDKANVRKVIHHTLPQSLEAYYQEAGRAGRDRQYAQAIILYTEKDIADLERSVYSKFPEYDFIKSVYESIMNALQLSVGDGSETLHFINPISIAQHLNMPILPYLSALKIIEQNKYWTWNMDDQSFHQVKFTVSRDEFSGLKVTHPSLYNFAIELLRMYGEIMHFLTKVDLTAIAQFTNSNFEIVMHQLKMLHQAGVIHYKPAQRGSSVFLIEDRIAGIFFSIDKKKFKFLKAIYIEQIEAMIAYVRADSTCRNILLARYFGEEQSVDCMHCDNCLQKHPSNDLKNMHQQIIDIVKLKQQIQLKELMTIFPQYQQKEIVQALEILANEQLLQIQGTNITFAL